MPNVLVFPGKPHKIHGKKVCCLCRKPLRLVLKTCHLYQLSPSLLVTPPRLL